MAEKTVGQQEISELPEIDKEELSSATDVMHSIVKTSKAFKMYLPNNPLLQRFFDDLKAKMGQHLGKHGELKLDIDQFEFRYWGKTVYENRDPKDSLAFRMYSDGIRSLIFSEGIEDREISDFLDIIGKEHPGDIDDDIVTLLWIKELPHITSITAEDYLEFDPAATGPVAQTSQQEKIKGLYSSIGAGPVSQTSQQDMIKGMYSSTSPPETVPTPMIVSKKIISLSAEEMAILKKDRDLDEKRSPMEEVVNVLTSILSVEKDVEVFGEFTDITASLVNNLLRAGEVNYAIGLIRLFRDFLKNEDVSQQYREKVARAMETSISADVLKDLQRIMDTTSKIKPDVLKELLLLFDKNAISPICELLGMVQKIEMRKVIVDALVDIGKDSPEAFYPFLMDGRWYLVRNALLILRRIGNPASLENVSRMSYHEDARVRKEVIQYLESNPDLRIKTTHIMKFLQDENSAIRIHALKTLGASGFQGAVKPILDIANAKNFEDKDISEKKAVFEALGELGSDSMVPMFKEMLMKKYWFNKAKEKEIAICAVSGLRKIKTDASIRALEEASESKNDEIKLMLAQAANSILSERTKAPTR